MIKLQTHHCLAIIFSIFVSAQADATIFLSNLSLPSESNLPIASDSWLAAEFHTGANPFGYRLNAVILSLSVPSGFPSGFSAALYSRDNITSHPGFQLDILSGPDPSEGGLFTFNSSGIELIPEKNYFIVITADTSLADGFYLWDQANSPFGYETHDGWGLNSGYDHAMDGTGWTFTRPYPLNFAVDATAIPEPTTFVLVLFGLLLAKIKIAN